MPSAVGVNDPKIQRLIAEANRGASASSETMPSISSPENLVSSLAAGYLQEDGKWSKEFEVRELTGRDEEALGRITDAGRHLITLMERGLVRLGDDPATTSRVNSLVAGDWDTVLLAVRAATFGPEVELRPTCSGCHSKYEVTINILTDFQIRTANPEDLSWTVSGKNHTYEVSAYTGSTQRRVFDLLSEGATVAAINTEILHDSIERIDGLPVLGKDTIRDLSLRDRKALLQSIDERRVGPNLQEVKIKCPTCGNEQPNPLNAAAIFQWN